MLAAAPTRKVDDPAPGAARLAGEKLAVMPEGSVPVDRTTTELKPPLTAAVTVTGTVEPWVTAAGDGPAASCSDGMGVVPALQLVTITLAFTEPNPVAASHPGPALNPDCPGTELLPVVMSWYAAAPPAACLVAKA